MDFMSRKVVVLSGAGISAESGIKTFRDADGLWEGHDVMEVASPEGWKANQELVLDFYNQRRKQLYEVEPNQGHIACVELEDDHDVTVITQNVDDLHERAGSSDVVHLHGELRKVRSTFDPTDVMLWKDDLVKGDLCAKGHQLRPHIVWFGEAVPMIERAAAIVMQADVVIVVGTSMQVYPAAGLVGYAPPYAEVYYVDPRPTISHELSRRSNLKVIKEVGSIGMKKVVSFLREDR